MSEPPTIPFELSSGILAKCIASPQAYQELGWLCDNIGGRVSGTESGHKAEEWGRDLFTRCGLQSVRFEQFQHTAWIRGSVEVGLRFQEARDVSQPVIPEKSGIQKQLIAVAHANSPEICDISAPIIDAGHGERKDFERLASRVAGNIVYCDDGASPGNRTLHRTEKLKIALEFGAAGLMISSLAPGNLARTGVCHYGSPSPIPSVGIAFEDGAMIRRLIERGEDPIASIRMSNEFQDSTARNVLADIPGTERPDEIVLAGAHLDSWDISQGASDNGIGVAIVLECARAIASLPRRPRRTIRFALWAAEELGLRGSLHYTRTHDLASHSAVMNFDMSGDPCGFWTPGFRDSSPLLTGLAGQLAGIGMTSERDTAAKLHSDHQHFMLAGVPTIGLKTDRTSLEGARYYHTSADTFDKVSQPILARAAAAAAHTLWALADSPRTSASTPEPPSRPSHDSGSRTIRSPRSRRNHRLRRPIFSFS